MIHLVSVDCIECRGEGSFLVAPGTPVEHSEECERCDGEGSYGVCAKCGQQLVIRRGIEVCGCVVLNLRPEYAIQKRARYQRKKTENHVLIGLLRAA
mgnify:CR=1 FL=1